MGGTWVIMATTSQPIWFRSSLSLIANLSFNLLMFLIFSLFWTAGPLGYSSSKSKYQFLSTFQLMCCKRLVMQPLLLMSVLASLFSASGHSSQVGFRPKNPALVWVIEPVLGLPFLSTCCEGRDHGCFGHKFGCRCRGDLSQRRRGNTITTFFILFPGIMADGEVQKISQNLGSCKLQKIWQSMGLEIFTPFQIGQCILYRQISGIFTS